MSLRSRMKYMTPYEIHKEFVNQYILRRPGDTKLLKRDSSKDRTDFDVIKENHKFLWNDKTPDTWEEQFAKKYYDKLFKEYCIGDLSHYKENKIALRWRTEQEVVTGKGQFICANRKCNEKEGLRTWEVNFAYREEGQKKNALVKIRLCPTCSLKLNYQSKKREVKRLKRKHLVGGNRHTKHHNDDEEDSGFDKEPGTSQAKNVADDEAEEKNESNNTQNVNESPWENQKPIETKSRDEEMEEYLQELLL